MSCIGDDMGGHGMARFVSTDTNKLYEVVSCQSLIQMLQVDFENYRQT